MRRTWLWMIPILLLMFILSAMYSNTDPLWGDERNTLQSTGGVFTPQFYTLPQLWEDVAQNHPEQLPGYQMLAAAWMHFVGVEPASIRLLSLLTGCLGLAWVYRLGCYVARSSRVGLYAALIFAPSILIVHYLTRVRTYSLLVALTAVVLFLYIRAVTKRGEPSRWLWVGLAVAVAGLLYTHYLVLLLLGAIGINHLILLSQARQSWMRRWWRVVFALVVGGLVFLLWLPNLFHGLGVEASTYDDVGLNAPQSLALMADFFGNGLPLLSVAALMAVLLTRGGDRLRHLRLIAAVNAAALLIYFVISNRLHQTRPAYLIGLWPLLVVLVAAAMARMERARGLQRLVAACLLAAFFFGGVYANLARDATEKMERFRYIFPIHVVDLLLRQNDIVGDRVVVALPDALTENEDEASRIAIENSRIDLKLTSYRAVRGSTLDTDQADAVDVGTRQRLWVAYAPDRLTSARASLVDTLAGNFQQCPRSLTLSQAHIDQYARVLTCCVDNPDQSAIAHFGDGIALLKVGLPTAPVHGDTILPLLWSVEAKVPPKTYSVTTQLFDAPGNKVGQSDYGLENGSRPCHPLALKLADLKPGVYTVTVAVYNWHDSQRLPGALTGNTPGTDLIPIGTVTVS